MPWVGHLHLSGINRQVVLEDGLSLKESECPGDSSGHGVSYKGPSALESPQRAAPEANTQEAGVTRTWSWTSHISEEQSCQLFLSHTQGRRTWGSHCMILWCIQIMSCLSMWYLCAHLIHPPCPMEDEDETRGLCGSKAQKRETSLNLEQGCLTSATRVVQLGWRPAAPRGSE